MVTDARETNRNYPVPDEANDISDDFPRLRSALQAIGVDVAALLASVAGKAPTVHTHAISQVTGLQTALDNKAALVHTHALDDLSDVDLTGATALQVLIRGASGWQPGSVAAANVTGLATAIAAAALTVAQLSDSTTVGRAVLMSASNAAIRLAIGAAGRTARGDANFTIPATAHALGLNAAFTAARTFTLPAANGVNPDDPLYIVDEVGAIGSTNTLSIARAGSDTINGGTSPFAVASPYAIVIAMSDGASAWTIKAITAAAASQPLDATLTALAALTTAANKLIYATGVDAFATADLTAFALTLLDDANAAAMRSTISAEQIGVMAGVNAQTASYTVVLADAGKTIEMNTAANTLTIPPNSSVPFPIGTYINIVQTGGGITTITPGAGVTLQNRNGLRTAGQWALATIYKTATDTWVVGGDIQI